MKVPPVIVNKNGLVHKLNIYFIKDELYYSCLWRHAILLFCARPIAICAGFQSKRKGDNAQR